MSELRVIFALWKREVVRYLRDRTRVIGSAINPILWLFVLGLSISYAFGNNIDYVKFIYPGILAQTMIFTGIFVGISLVWDRDFGFLKEILVAPISRFSIIFSRALGGATNALLQGIIILMLSFTVGIFLSITSIIYLLLVMILIAFSFVAMSIFIATRITSIEGFGVIASFVTFPLFFLSGALYPLNNVPEAIKIATYLDPLTYGVDALRFIISGSSYINFWTDIFVISSFGIIMLLLATYSISRKK